MYMYVYGAMRPAFVIPRTHTHTHIYIYIYIYIYTAPSHATYSSNVVNSRALWWCFLFFSRNYCDANDTTDWTNLSLTGQCKPHWMYLTSYYWAHRTFYGLCFLSCIMGCLDVIYTSSSRVDGLWTRNDMWMNLVIENNLLLKDVS